MAQASTVPANDGGPQNAPGECRVLLEACTAEVFVNNIFKITGLAVDVTPREIAKQMAERKLQAELGQSSAQPGPSLFGREKLPSIQSIRDAEQKLREPELRLVHELFWFWPIDPGGSKVDPALRALAAGDTGTAEKLWKAAENSADRRVAATHNLAVRRHLTALNLERHWNSDKADDKARETLTTYWLSALKRWDLLMADHSFWEIVAQRARALDDPRLTTTFVTSIRDTLPSAIAGINAMLMLKHLQSNADDLVAMHARLMNGSRLILTRPSGFSDLVLAKAKAKIREYIKAAQAHLDSQPTTAIEAARDLVAILERYSKLFSVLGIADTSGANDILDEGAGVCMNCAVRSNKETDDDAAFVEVFERIQLIVKGPEAKERARKNLETGRTALVYKVLVPLRDSKELPSARLQAFERAAVSLLDTTLARLGASVEARMSLADDAAQLLRGISLDAWNGTQDSVTAFAALKLAMRYASGKAAKDQLHEDFTALNRLIQERKDIETRKKVKAGAWAIGIPALLIWLFVGSNGSNKPAARTNSNASVATWTPPASDAEQGPGSPAQDAGRRTYRVPTWAVGGLEQDSAAVEVQKTLARQLENQLRDANRQLEDQKARADDLQQQLDTTEAEVNQARPFVDASDPASVNGFNQRVDGYNRLLHRYRGERKKANALVEPYNELVDKVNAQNHLVNQMVDAYNEKLQRVGH
jgi:hypothetical protein